MDLGFLPVPSELRQGSWLQRTPEATLLIAVVPVLYPSKQTECDLWSSCKSE